MAGRRARTGRGWDAAPPRARRRPSGTQSQYSGRSYGGGTAPDEPAAAAPAVAPAGPPQDPYEQAREICLRQLAVRPRTRAELATALRKRGVDDEVAAAVLDRYDEVGIVDDAAFAHAWVTSRHQGRGLARRALANELRQKGVDTEVADEALDEIDGDTEAATARSLVDRKLRSMGTGPPEAAFRRLAAMLARKGYPAGVAIGAVKDALAARAESQAFAADLDVDALADVELGEGSTGL
jgi:regulatory protein